MISKIGRTLTIVALCLSIGFHWVALQSVAWATMLVEHARHESLSVALVRTFDGAHPCNICHVVTEGKGSEKKSDILPTIVKLDLFCPAGAATPTPPSVPYEYAASPCNIVERFLAPPAPPPRLLA